jgi:predicted AAA+ superfamily ATPase
MTPRLHRSLIEARLQQFPAVGLVGPRQAGKTTLAKAFSDHYFDLEQERDRVRLDLIWNELMQQEKLIILDEAQTWPEVFARLRGDIDAQRKRNGRFLILGSVSPLLMREVSESLAGRIAIVEMSPLGAAELPDSSHDALWRCGGFPDGGVLQQEVTSFPVWQHSYLEQMAQRDLPAWGLPSKPGETMRLLRLTAALNGTALNYSQLGQSMGTSYHTVQSHLDYLEGAYLIRRLRPFFANNFPKRLTKAPKLYWRDSGLLHALMGVTGATSLTDQGWVGASWEGWIIEQIIATRQAAGETFEAWYFRTNDGLECDLVIESGQEREVIEIKLAAHPESGDFRRLEKIAHLVKATRQVMITRIRDAEVVMQGDRWSVNLASYLSHFTPRPVATKSAAPSLTVPFLYDKLREAAGAMFERGILTQEILLRRAQWLKQDLDAIAWEDFQILPTQIITPPGTGMMIPLVEYSWGQDQYSTENHTDPFITTKDAQAADGTGLSRENLTWLGRISEIGHTLIPDLWLSDKRLLREVRERNQHLNTLNEIWWLSCWHGVDAGSVQREYILRRDAKNLAKPYPATMDWRFTIMGGQMAINLSVKNRQGTVTSKSMNKRVNLFSEKDAFPFSPSGADEINVLALTCYHGGVLTASEQHQLVTNYLEKTPEIDAVVIWIKMCIVPAANGTLTDSLHLYFPKNRALDRKDLILRAILKEVTIEDSAVVGVLHHTVGLNDLVAQIKEPKRILES